MTGILDEYSGYVERSDLLRFEGWTLVQLSGDIPVDGKTGRLRMCFKSPTGEYRNVFVEPHDEDDLALQYHHSPAQQHHRENFGRQSAVTGTGGQGMSGGGDESEALPLLREAVDLLIQYWPHEDDGRLTKYFHKLSDYGIGPLAEPKEPSA